MKMYEPIDSEFVPETETIENPNVNTTDEREKFVDNFLASNLNETKQREKETIKEKLKFKKHQLDVASKQLRKENKKKRDAIALVQSDNTRTDLSRKLKKSLQMYKLNKNEKLDYSKYEEINRLWNCYANSCLMTCLTPNNNLSEENVLNCLKQLDYHGCHLTVSRSSSKHLIGLNGIVLQDRKNVFFILTKENQIKILPKENNLFEFNLIDSNFRMTLVGSNMMLRPEMRTTKHAKIKTRININ